MIDCVVHIRGDVVIGSIVTVSQFKNFAMPLFAPKFRLLNLKSCINIEVTSKKFKILLLVLLKWRLSPIILAIETEFNLFA